ncbi:MAG: polysaccharide biosynthesis protein [Roseburia sp.]|nr:polysaccharide biosynthesis protein [Roseburia sp.]
MGKKKSSTGFLVQGSILAMASIISRIIGLLYRIPLIGIIGDVGMDYYATAFEIYNNLLIISSYSLPLAVSKLVSADMSRGRRKNVYRILRGALIFATATGGAAALILFFGAEAFTVAMKTPFSIFAVRVLIPTLIVVAVLGVLRGFFQGLGSMMPSAISQVLEQIANAIISVWAAYVLYKYGMKVGAILGNQENYAAAYGAAGGTLGTGIGAVVALIFSCFVLFAYMHVYKRQTKREGMTKVDSYRHIFHTLIITIIPVLLSTTIYNCNTLIDMAVFKNIANAQGYSALEISTWNGVYTGRYKTLINVPISIASALAASSVPALTAAYTKKDLDEVRSQINSAIRFIMLIAIPCAVGMGVLAGPILQTVRLSDESGIAAVMLQYGAVSIVFFSLSTLSNGLLQGINRMKEPVKNAAIALVLHIIVLVVLMYGFDLNIYAVIFANTSFGLIMSLLNALSIRKYVGYRQEIVKTFLIPTLSAGIMGVAVWGIYKLLIYILRINTIATILSIVLGAIIYFALMLLLKGMGEAELRRLPKGYLLVKLAKKAHLLK